MNKFLAHTLFVSILLIQAVAFAAPFSAGTVMKINITVKNSKGQVKDSGTAVYTLKDYNKVENSYLVNVKLQMKSSAPQELEQWADAQMVEAGREAVKSCPDMEGKLVDVVVPAGTFRTCYISERDLANGVENDYWYGGVPFGEVKSSERQSADEILYRELSSLE